ncbi:hypothetical protein Ga0100231_012125 [Opitutaceae bacterium TAV4]|nr:hypothetical protein Ga0100231_012125 [Opitutaceae bacterium TAV4]RRK02808.1 hypothetical protein Ga0100230_002485 [Opitutaceae bacterium TAV3]
MTPKKRVLTTFANQAADRVPINYLANAGIDARLKKHFGLAPDDSEGVLQALEVDFRRVVAPYIGPKLHEDIPERGIRVDCWGVRTQWVENESGGYWDFCEFPLEHADEEAVARWPMPSPDDFDYSQVEQFCRKHGSFAISVGNPGVVDVINANGRLRGMEQTLIDLVSDEPAGLLLADRRIDIQMEVTRRIIEASKGGVDFVWMGEDLGTQIAPMISLDLYRRHLRPRHQRFIDMARSFNLPVMVHSCGSSSWAYEDFIEMGVTAVDTLQPEATNMSPEYLKTTFGGRLAFHGCISTAGPVAYGTTNEVTDYCRKTLEIMMPGGGYCFSPTHQLQDNSPVENVLAMYQVAHTHGHYR